MNAFKGATIEISSICNAKCTWCTTGIKNRSGCKASPEFMSPQSFEKGLLYMKEQGIIDENTELELYNWGEPFLNPEINEICGIIVKHGYSFHLSTNASVFRSIAPENLRTLSGFRVSLSGFSKETYAVTHALDYDHVIENISKFADMLKRAGKLHCMNVSYLTYKYNCHEIYPAKEYFDKLGISMTPRLAYFADFRLFQQFLTDTLPEDVKELSEKHIFGDLLKKRALSATADYACPQNEFIVLGHNWEVVPCCILTENNSLGTLFDMSLEDIRKAKAGNPLCTECIASKQHYVIHSPTEFRFSIDPPYTAAVSDGTPVMPKLYLDYGDGFSEEHTLIKGTVDGKSGVFYAEYNLRDAIPTNIRLDPVENKYCIIDELTIATENGLVEYSEINGFEADGILYFDNFDPQIICKNIRAEKLIISARIHTFTSLALLHAIRNIRKTTEAFVTESSDNISAPESAVPEFIVEEASASEEKPQKPELPPLAKIYYDIGRGYGEEHTLTKLYNLAEEHFVFEYKMPVYPIAALRFDPADFPCKIKDFKIKLDGKLANISFCNAQHTNNNEYIFDTDDPFFIIDIADNANIDTISVEFEISK